MGRDGEQPGRPGELLSLLFLTASAALVGLGWAAYFLYHLGSP
jgi:hypothetical protein